MEPKGKLPVELEDLAAQGIAFGELDISIRALFAGMSTLLAVALVGVVALYLLRDPARQRWRWQTGRWWEPVVTPAALAILILVTGHAIRAALNWGAYSWMDAGWPLHIWIHWEPYVFASILIIVGKLLFLWFFTPEDYRRLATFGSLAVAFLVSLTLSLAL